MMYLRELLLAGILLPLVQTTIKTVVDSKIPITETFIYYETQYIIFSERVTWDEAAAICPSYKAQLAVVDDIHKAEFLAETMADSNAPMEDVWLGGRIINDVWMWAATGDLVPSAPGSDGFPPWVYNPTRTGKECIAMDRRGHDAPLFLDLNCHMTRPFVCEKSAALDEDVPQAARRYKSGYSVYTLYHARVTWSDAVAFCRQNGKRLAIIPSKDVASMLAQTMMKSRPDFENAWIGARFEYGSWVWIATGEELPLKTDPRTGYPPWRLNKTRSQAGCALLDRHLRSSPVFLEAKCSRTRDFICEEVVPSEVVEPTQRVKNEGLMYELVPLNRSWDESSESCKDRGGHLVTMETQQLMNFVIDIMADYTTQMTHVWVGGILEGNKWMWETNGKEIPFPTGPDNYPPWCDNETRPDMACLNLDRSDHNQPMLYGLECNNTQPYICQVDCIDPDLVNNGDWNCTEPLQPRDRRCWLKCDRDYILFGSSSLVCSIDGWLGIRNLSAMPQCQSVAEAGNTLVDQIGLTLENDKPSGILFIIHDGAAVSDSDYTSQLQLVAAVVQAYPLQDDFHAGVLASSDGVTVLLPYRQSDTCYVMDSLSNLTQNRKKTGSSRFDKVLKEVQDQITHLNHGKKTIIVLITVGQLDGGPYDKDLDTLSDQGHIFFTVGVGSGYSATNLSDISSIAANNLLNFFAYNDFSIFTRVTQYIIEEYRSKDITCSAKFLIPHRTDDVRRNLVEDGVPSQSTSNSKESHHKFKALRSKRDNDIAVSYEEAVSNVWIPISLPGNINRDHTTTESYPTAQNNVELSAEENEMQPISQDKIIQNSMKEESKESGLFDEYFNGSPKLKSIASKYRSPSKADHHERVMLYPKKRRSRPLYRPPYRVRSRSLKHKKKMIHLMTTTGPGTNNVITKLLENVTAGLRVNNADISKITKQYDNSYLDMIDKVSSNKLGSFLESDIMTDF